MAPTEKPPPPPTQDLGGGVWSITVPIPDNPLRYTLVYLLESDRGIVQPQPTLPFDLRGNAFGEFCIEVADGNLGALRCKFSRGRGTQSRCAAGDDGGLIL